LIPGVPWRKLNSPLMCWKPRVLLCSQDKVWGTSTLVVLSSAGRHWTLERAWYTFTLLILIPSTILLSYRIQWFINPMRLRELRLIWWWPIQREAIQIAR
jgi:hypothetical protein